MTTVFERMGVPIDLGERRFLHPGPLRWLRASAWMVVLVVVTALIGYGVVIFAEKLLDPWGGPGKLAASVIGAAVTLALYGALVRLAEGRKADEIALHIAIPGILAGLAIGAAVFATVMIVLIGSGLYDFTWRGPTSAWTGVSLSVQSGVIEEVIARGVLMRLTWRAFGPWAAFIVSAAVFGGGHFGNPNASAWAAACIAVEAGLLLCAFYALTGRLWVSIGLHAGWNFTQGYLFGAAVSGTDFGGAIATSTARAGLPAWLTGGAFGPEASLPALVICTSVGLVTTWMAWQAGRFAKATPVPARTA